MLHTLNAISPIDGRYRNKTIALADYFSEQALIRYRVKVEIDYFIAMSKLGFSQLPPLSDAQIDALQNVVNNFNENDAQWIKEVEKTTNHDVKAVEYFVKDVLDKNQLSEFKEFVHFGLTSQDINNTAIPLSVKEAYEKVYRPLLIQLISKIKALASEWIDIPMLARTHGQPASPTTLGKEFLVFAVRLEEQLRLLQNVPFAAKFGGATGNFNAHYVAFPQHNWKDFGRDFVENQLGLHYSFPTTQIEHYDHFAAFCDGLKRINNILIDFDRDVWTYVSLDYFKQKIKAGEIGSSAMPHKVNPIDFENSEGNLGMANAIFEFLAGKLPISRLQRDLTDSTVLRNVGVPFGHTIIAFESTLKGLDKLLINSDKIAADLEQQWAVVAEAIQTILRREKYPNPYEALKALTRTNQIIDKNAIHQFINELDMTPTLKNELLQITPQNYIGVKP